MKPSDVEKLIAKMDPAVSKIYYDAKHVLETVEDSESEEFLAAARIVIDIAAIAMVTVPMAVPVAIAVMFPVIRHRRRSGA